LSGLPPAAPGSSTGLPPHVAAALAYVAGPLSGALLLTAERSSPEVRFHAWQSIVALGALWTLGVGLWMLAFASILVSAKGLVVLLWLSGLVWAGSIALGVVCAVRAYKGQQWRLPVAGPCALRRTGTLP